MKILMFGWEYPPYITGGLGTACHGLSRSLARIVDRITFVMPRLAGPSRSGPVELVCASEVEEEVAIRREKAAASGRNAEHDEHEDADENAPADESDRDLDDLMEFITIDSPLRPYVTPEAYLAARDPGAPGGVSTDAHARRSAGDRGNDPLATFHAAAEQHGHDILRVEPLRRHARRRRRRHKNPMTGSYGPGLFEEIARYAAVAGGIARKGAGFDVVHAHDWMTFPAGVAAKRALKVPLVVHVHALEYDRCGEAVHQDVFAIEKLGMEHADSIIAVSHRTKQMIVERYGIDEAKVQVVHNGIAHHVPRSGDVVRRLPERLVVFLGRITMQKGPEYFLEAAYLVRQRMRDVRFVMAGTGDLWTRMVARMAELDLLDCFHFTGFVDERRRHELLSLADAFVMSSVSEPFGLTPVEALQYGVPVIVSRQSGVAEVLQGAIKVDFWDTHRIADAIYNVLRHDDLAQQLREDGGRDLARIDWDSAAKRVVAVYEEVLR